MSELSPAAEAVLDAYYTHADLLNRKVSHEEMLAAALRAAADQVVPNDPLAAPVWTERDEIRAAFFAIADELEGK